MSPFTKAELSVSSGSVELSESNDSCNSIKSMTWLGMMRSGTSIHCLYKLIHVGSSGARDNPSWNRARAGLTLHRSPGPTHWDEHHHTVTFTPTGRVSGQNLERKCTGRDLVKMIALHPLSLSCLLSMVAQMRSIHSNFRTSSGCRYMHNELFAHPSSPVLLATCFLF